MGLGITHGCGEFSYGGFAQLRQRLCEAAGLPTTPSELGGRYIAADWENITQEQVAGHWGDVVPVARETIYGPYIQDPLLYLLIHSDCDGVLEHSYLQVLRDRLEEIAPKMADGPWYHNPRSKVKGFIDGLDRAIAAGENVEFH